MLGQLRDLRHVLEVEVLRVAELAGRIAPAALERHAVEGELLTANFAVASPDRHRDVLLEKSLERPLLRFLRNRFILDGCRFRGFLLRVHTLKGYCTEWPCAKFTGPNDATLIGRTIR